MGEPVAAARAGRSPGPAPAATSYEPDPAERARLAFADGPAQADAPGDGGATGGSGPSRLALAAAAAAVAVLVVGAIAVFGRVGRSDDAIDGDVAVVVDQGPFDTTDAFLGALPLPASFTRLAPDDVSAFATADAEYVVDGDFDAACASLGRALRAVDPAYPDLVPKEYEGGGVNRCEAEAPMAALHGATVRALVLEVNNGAQLYIGEPAVPGT